jgi:Fic family protein
MRGSFGTGAIEHLRVPPALLSTVRLIGENKGKQDLYKRTAPAVLDTLLQVARIQSVESSNRIEGITAPLLRLKEIVEDKTTPANRSEAEIAGYRDALSLVHTYAREMPFTTGLVLQLHRDLSRYLADPGGQWKTSDNLIEEESPDGTRRTRFVPVKAFLTAEAMESLHVGFSSARAAGEVDDLILFAAYCLDFLCIHPFRDGNGRISRLLSLLLLYQAGYEVGRYVSLEKVIEDSKATYYAALGASSTGWHDGRHDLLPWVEYFLGVLVAAYRELDARVQAVAGAPGAKSRMVVDCIERLPVDFRVGDIERVCPNISRPTINRVLRDLRREGKLEATRGRDARWRKVT